MAAKIECPNCKSVLKEEGDKGKTCTYEYRVYENLWNVSRKAGEFRMIQCLGCGNFGNPCDFK